MNAAIPDSVPLDSFAPRGHLHSTTIPYLFHEIWTRRATGALTVTQHDVRKTVEFDKGIVLFGSSGDRDERFSQILLRSDVLPLKSMMRGLEVALNTKDRLGEVLVRMKLMSATDVEKWVKVQVREIVYSLFRWTDGQYHFEEKPMSGTGIALGVTGDAMVVEGIRRIHSWIRTYEQVGGLNAEYLTTREMPGIVRGLPLRPEENALLQMCKAPTTLNEMCETSEMGDCEVCKSVWALLVVGALMKA